MMDVRETQNRLGRAATYGRGGEDEEDEEGIGRRRYKTSEQLATRKDARKRYQFEATASDDEMEDELDDNLDEIARATKGLNLLGRAMGEELDSQNDRIGKIDAKTRELDERVYTATMAVRKFRTRYILLSEPDITAQKDLTEQYAGVWFVALWNIICIEIM
jgi:protein transport protein SEC9